MRNHDTQELMCIDIDELSVRLAQLNMHASGVNTSENGIGIIVTIKRPCKLDSLVQEERSAAS